MAETSPQWLNIALLPHEQCGEVLQDMSDSIRDSCISLGHQHLSHVSVYQAQFTNIETIRGVIETMREKLAPFTLSMKEFATPGAGFIFADTDLPRALGTLHEYMLQALAPHRIPMTEEALTQLSTSRPAQQIENLRQYGMALAGTHYRPHATIGLVHPGAESEVLDALSQKFALPRELYCNRLAILDCDAANGSAKTVHTEWQLTTLRD